MSRLAMLALQAGPHALAHFQQHGLSMQDFGYILAASGGPKWLILSALDQYLCEEHLPKWQGLTGLGTSAGAFRLACYAQNNPSAAIEAFKTQYINTTYSGPRPDLTERDNSVKHIIDAVMVGKENEILSSKHVKANWITARCKGIGANPNMLSQIANLGLSYAVNRLDRKHMGLLYSRACFHAPDCQLDIKDPYKIPTEYYSLTNDNLYDSLLASGTIPLFSPLRQNIADAPGSHLDGGLVDYHFDLQLRGNDKANLVLYPHFSTRPRSGWFDKKLARPPLASSYSRVLLITPSQQYFDSLETGQIPERNDFRSYDDNTRQRLWHQAINQAKRLADELHEVIEQQDLSCIKPLQLS